MNSVLLRPDALALEGALRRDLDVLVIGGQIADLPRRRPGATPVPVAGTLLPGGIDLQVNGAGGHGVEEGTPEALDAIAAAVLAGGAHAFLPTLISAPFDLLLERLDRVVAWIETAPRAGALPLGVHVEGPFLEVPGAHPEDALVDPTPERVDALLERGRGHLRLVTLAPDRPGAAEATRRLSEAGVCVALGHGAGVERFDDCVAAGARMATHLFNAMSPLHHRAPGLVGRVLDEKRLCASLILDGHHVSDVAARIAWNTLGPLRTVLVTDSMAAAGMPDGEYDLSGAPVTVAGGVVRDRAGRLAGSSLTFADAVRGLARVLERVDPLWIASATSGNPARLLGETTRGRIAPGLPADLAVLLADGTYGALRLE